MYHRKLGLNERVLRIALKDNKFACLLFTFVSEQDRWVCVTNTETMLDLENLQL